MKKYIILASLLSLCSCISDIDIRPGKEFKACLAVDGMITNIPDRQYVKLSRTSQSGIVYTPVNGAKVSVSDGDSSTVFTGDNVNGLYHAPDGWSASPGKTYTLTVKTDAEGIEGTYTASSTIPDYGFSLDKISATYNETTDLVEIHIWMQVGVNDYTNTCFEMEVNGLVLSTGTWNGMNDFQGKYLEDLTILPTWTNSNDYVSYDGRNAPEKLAPGDTVSLYLYTSDYGYYNFLRSHQNVIGLYNPITIPQPANVPTNISGDAVGYFSACFGSGASTILE